MSNMFEGFTDKVTKAKGAGDRNPYTLDEDLAIMDMISNDVKLKEIADVTGRPLNSLRYRYIDPKRGVQKILTKGGPAALYERHKVAVPTDIVADATARVEEYKATRVTVAA